MRASPSGVPIANTPSTFSTRSRPPVRADRRRERRGRGARAAPVSSSEVQHRLAAALDEQAERAVDEHDERARLAAGPVAAVPLVVESVGQPSAAPNGFAGSVAASVSATDRAVGRLGSVSRSADERAQPVDGRRGRELGGAEPLDEVAAAGAPGLLEPAQHLVRGRESADDALGHHRAAGDDAVPLEQLLGERGGPDGRARLRARAAGSSVRRPSAARSRRGSRRPTRGRRGAAASAHGARLGGVARERVVVAPSRARSGASVSLLTSPAQVRSQSACARSLSSTGAGHRQRGRQLPEEERPAAGERIDDAAVQLGLVDERRLGERQRRGVGEVQRDPAVAAAAARRAPTRAPRRSWSARRASPGCSRARARAARGSPRWMPAAPPRRAGRSR